VPAVELSPRPAFYVAGLRGRGGQAAIEIVNHESEPLQIERIENPTERFTTQLETLEPGQHLPFDSELKTGRSRREKYRQHLDRDLEQESANA